MSSLVSPSHASHKRNGGDCLARLRKTRYGCRIKSYEFHPARFQSAERERMGLMSLMSFAHELKSLLLSTSKDMGAQRTQLDQRYTNAEVRHLFGATITGLCIGQL